MDVGPPPTTTKLSKFYFLISYKGEMRLIQKFT